MCELQILVGQTNHLVYQRIGGLELLWKSTNPNLERENIIEVTMWREWVVGGVERTPEQRIFLILVENRNQDILLRLIDQFVEPAVYSPY